MKNPDIDTVGTKRWYNEAGELHRDNDLPAVIYYWGDVSWYQNGLRHRKAGLPAIEYNNGIKCWYQNGFIIRRDEWTNG